jgi:hypothetical protein
MWELENFSSGPGQLWWPITGDMLAIHFQSREQVMCENQHPPPRPDRLFNPRFPGLTLRYRYAVTWTCDQHAGSHSSTPSSTSTSSPSATSSLEHRVSVFPFSICCVEVTHTVGNGLESGQIRQNQSWYIALASRGGPNYKCSHSLTIGGTRELLKRSIGTSQEEKLDLHNI